MGIFESKLVKTIESNEDKSPESAETIECTVNNMFENLEGKGTCKLSSQNKTYITVYSHNNSEFNDKFKSLEECFDSPLNSSITKPLDLSKTNTLWVEHLSNESNKKGFGKKLFKSMVDKAKKFGYKYVFLYPSSSLTNDKVKSSNQDVLIGVYTSYGLKQLKSCPYYVTELDKEYKFENNFFDKEAPNHLMFGKIDDLKLGDNYSEIPVNYREKYLKYKAKYLNLKKITDNKKY